MKIFDVIKVAAVLGICATGANAATFGFKDILNSNPTNGAAGEAQLSVEVSAGTAVNTVMFTFRNIGNALMSIADVYFDDDVSLLTAGSLVITNSSGVSFSQGATPGNLPQGTEIDFEVNPTGASADLDAPAQPNGVNPGEVLKLTYSLLGSKTVDDVVAALQASALKSGKEGNDVGLRIGLHVQGFGDTESDSFVSSGCTDCGGGTGFEVPVPASLPLLLTALGAGGFILRRRQNKSA